MDWRDVDPDLGLLFDDIAGTGAYYALERQLWIELWRVPELEAVEEEGIEVRHYGPVLAFAFRHEPRTALFNVLLGADRHDAVARGHLAEALEWTESIGLDLRIPVRGEGEFDEAGETEDFLNRRGYRRTGAQATFARGVGEPGFEASPGIAVEELAGEEMVETFANLLAPAYGLDWTNDFIVGLPGRREWRTYIARDDSGPIAAAAMMMHYEKPQFAFAGAAEPCRRRGAHLALLRRRIEDARAAGAEQLFAVTEETPECPDTLSAGARNLLRAGFGLLEVRTVWQPPEELLAPERGDEEDDEDEWGDGGEDREPVPMQP
jgi:hypothetical protein